MIELNSSYIEQLTHHNMHVVVFFLHNLFSLFARVKHFCGVRWFQTIYMKDSNRTTKHIASNDIKWCLHVTHWHIKCYLILCACHSDDYDDDDDDDDDGDVDDSNNENNTKYVRLRYISRKVHY